MSDKENTHWYEQKERGTLLGIKFLFFVYSKLGSVILVPFLYPVVFYFFVFGRQSRQAIYSFLQRALVKQSGEPVNSIDIFKLFMAFSRSILDKLASWSGKISREKVSFPDRYQLKQAIESGQGGIILGSHLGSIEVSRAFSRDMPDFKLNVLVHTQHAGNFNQMMREINPEFQTEMIQVTSIGPDTAMILKQKIERGEFVAILGDRSPVESQGREVWVDFLGKEAPFPQGPYILAAILSCPLYMLTCVRDGRIFKVFFDVLSMSVELPRKTRQEAIGHYASLYADKLANYAREFPYQWFNFFDFWRELAPKGKDK
ncbi:MAG: hypothetical protein MI867_01040 [Pseudomonadales bacterium]|nr:hypothetical protein [Pseudomonadales bacterium]